MSHEHGFDFENGEDYACIFTPVEYVLLVHRQLEKLAKKKNSDLRLIYILKLILGEGDGENSEGSRRQIN